MTDHSRISVHWLVLVGGVAGLLAVGAGAAVVTLRSREHRAQPVEDSDRSRPAASGAAPSGAVTAGPGTSMLLPDVAVPLSKDGADRAGVRVAAVTAGPATESLRVPAVVEPNTYTLIAVTPLVGGRLTRVTAELGQRVQRGEVIAQIFSPELAELQTRYISARADLDAHERELARTEKLVQIGSASRQELERIHADHTARRAGLQSAAARLRLLGLADAAIDALGPGSTLDAITSVPAPIAGVVTERMANVGQNVDEATKLFTIVDMSRVWVVADVFERDVARVHVGSTARVTTSAYPGQVLQGQVSYIDPQVQATSRTARVRIEVPNARGELRLGMFVDVVIGVSGRESIVVPRGAIQQVGDRTVVYFADPQAPGRFIEREVRLGASTGPLVTVIAGLVEGDVVVTEGSFSIRAERERLGLRPAAGPSPTGGAPSAEGQSASITLGEQGYDPSRVTLRAGVPARLTVVRTTDKTCGTEIVFPFLNLKRPLPLNEPVVITFTPSQAGELAFTCGMNMLRGTVVVQ